MNPISMAFNLIYDKIIGYGASMFWMFYSMSSIVFVGLIKILRDYGALDSIRGILGYHCKLLLMHD